MKKVPKDYAAFLKPYIDARVLTIESGSKHNKAVRSDGRFWVIPSSPSDHRGFLNFKSDIRRFVSQAPQHPVVQ